MPESFTSALDDRCSALENFVEKTGTQYAQWRGLRVPSSIRNGYGRSQLAIADGDRLKAAIYIPKVQDDVSLPFPTIDGDGRVTKQRGKRARAKSEGNEEPQRQTPSPRKGSSIHYGVRFRPDLHKWVAEIRVAEWKDVGKKVWLGTFDTEEGAGRGVDLARKLLKCAKKRPPNLPCLELDHYSTRIPPHLDLTDIANDTMFKDVVLFIKNECQAYAASFPPTSTPILIPQPQSTTANPNTLLGHEEADIMWNVDMDDELALCSDSELILPAPDPHHNAPNVDVGLHGHNCMDQVPVLITSADFDMDGLFEGAFQFGSSSSPGSSAPSSFTAVQEFQFQFEQNEIVRGASLEQQRARSRALEMEMEMEMAVEPVCQDLAAVAYNLPQTWPGAASPSSRAFQFPMNSGLQSEQSPFCISPVDGGDMTFLDTLNHWSLQAEQFQFQMDMN